MQIKEYYQVLTNNRKSYFTEWLSPAARAIIILVHGLGEHIRRYDEQFSYFTEKGYSCISADLKGHGRSEGARGVWDSIEDHYEVVTSLFKAAKKNYPDLPIVLYGHSMGGNITAGYMIDKRPKVNALILTGSAISTPKDLPAFVINGVLSGPAFLKNLVISNGLNLKSLCSDKKIVDLYTSDPLVHNRISLASGAVILKNAQNILSYKVENDYPILLMHGEKDKICYPESTTLLKEVFMNNPTIKIWAGLLHEIHNEVNKKEVWDYTIQWLDRNIGHN